MARQSVFLVTPIGSSDSPERKNSDRLLEWVIEPVCNELDLKVERADKLSSPGRITNQIAEKVVNSELVIADLTGLNPNVMYEVGVRHGKHMSIVQLATHGTKLPFDILDIRTVFYKLDLDNVNNAKSELAKLAKEALEGKSIPFSTGIDKTSNVDIEQENSVNSVLNIMADTLSIIQRDVREGRQENRQYVELLYKHILEIQDTKNTEVGLGFLSQIVGQGIQNPSGLREFAQVMQEFGNQEESQSQLEE
ncbi:MAG: hypothetical protein AAGE84_29680 [Cyanobacteria bacterium P01_G01_bin.39]